MSYSLFDTHTHFDVPEFDPDREQLAYAAKQAGVARLILIGFVQERFADLLKKQHMLNQLQHAPHSYFAPGLHPFYIEQHCVEHLSDLERLLRTEDCAAIGEIGLDYYWDKSFVEMDGVNTLMKITLSLLEMNMF